MAENQEFNRELQGQVFRRNSIVLEIVGAGIFIALSALVSALTTAYIPRIPGWGMAFLDPISAVWIICMVVFGWRAGLLCTAGGSLILFFFDPTGIGPLFKFAATIPFIIVPTLAWWMAEKWRSRGDPNCIPFQEWLKPPRNYFVPMIIAWAIRVPIMLLCNAIMFLTILSHVIPYVNLGFLGLPGVTAWAALTWGVIIINSWQSAFDILVPYFFTRIQGIPIAC